MAYEGRGQEVVVVVVGGGYRDGVEERAERFVAEVEGLELMMRQVCANTCRIAVRARI